MFVPAGGVTAALIWAEHENTLCGTELADWLDVDNSMTNQASVSATVRWSFVKPEPSLVYLVETAQVRRESHWETTR